MFAVKNESIAKAKKIFASKKEIYLLCHILSIRPEDNKAEFRRKN
jgi:hypothetical protein